MPRMVYCTKKDFPIAFSELRDSGKGFLFIIDYPVENMILCPADSCAEHGIYYSLPSETNKEAGPLNKNKIRLSFTPPEFDEYLKAFEHVRKNLEAGNSYLANLTFSSAIDCGSTLREIFDAASSPYKLYFNDKFTVFSPESFVRITDATIRTFPMKGTIDASTYDAVAALMNDEKEYAEHLTVVDLLRNDLGIVAENIEVERYRYAEKIPTAGGGIYQTSSSVKGKLLNDYSGDFGSLLLALLPAGSVTGAPKVSTVSILHEAETHERGFYTGVFGYCRGDFLESAVMIRFIENTGSRLLYKSGGGITVYSDPRDEYEELISKIYIPVG